VLVDREENNMSLIETTGDIWTYVPTHRIVIPTNTLGVMGAGLALAAKQKYPGIQDAYKWALTFMPDKRVPWWDKRFPDLILAPTKRHWVDKSRPQDVADILLKLSKMQGGPYAIPEMGCGLGGLAWEFTKGFYKVFETAQTEWVLVHPQTTKPSSTQSVKIWKKGILR